MISVDSHSLRSPPGPNYPVQLNVDAKTLATLQELRAEYGDTIRLVKPNRRVAYFVNEAADVRNILVKHHSTYIKGPGFERIKMLLGNGLIVSDGDIWRRSRRMIQPSFSRQHMHEMIKVMFRCCIKILDRWSAIASQAGAINITEETSDFALEVILISILGSDYESRCFANGENPFAFVRSDTTREISAVPKFHELRMILLEIIETRRSGKQSFDFLSMYMKATDKDGVGYSDKELVDELLILIVAGYETAASTLNWIWFLVTKHPVVEQQLLNEFARLSPHSLAVNPDDLANMTYTQQVIDETLRLYPPAWLLTRRAQHDDKLLNYDVPPGTDIYISPYILQRMDKHWPHPLRFDPTRFAATRTHSNSRPYFPFSLGPRRCIGEYFSFLEMKTHLGLLLPRFRMTLMDDGDPEPEMGILMRSARDIMLRPTLRN